MKERIPLLGGFAVLAIALFFGSLAVGRGIENRGKNDTISVTGSAKQRITSDYVIWDSSISSQQKTPQAAAKELAGWTQRLRSFLQAHGVLDSEVTLQPVTAQTVTTQDGALAGYQLTRSLEVRSARVAQIAAVVTASSSLLEQGIPVQLQPIQYIFTKLASIRPQLLAAATRDALGRAKVLVGATGGKLGSLRDVNVGVFQVTSPNSTDVSDYGVYDTSTLQKDVTAVVNVTFGLK